MRNLLSAIFIMVSVIDFCFAQTVTTLGIRGLNGPNGFAIDKAGRLYIANEPGKQVIRIVNDSITEQVIFSDSPDGLAFDDSDNLYVSNFYSGTILKVSDHSVDTFAIGLRTPADIKWDGKGNLYVSEYETGIIKKINSQGEIIEFVKGLKNPFGLTFDKEGNLYISNNTTGIIDKVTSAGVVSFFAQIPGSISYLTYSKKTRKLYIACFSCHNIYAITKEGNTKLIAGNGLAGYKDGNIREAQFTGPNSIVISSEGSLYISEFSVNRVRKIYKVEN